MTAPTIPRRDDRITLELDGFDPGIRDDLERLARLVASMLAEGARRETLAKRLMRDWPQAGSWPPPEAQP